MHDDDILSLLVKRCSISFIIIVDCQLFHSDMSYLLGQSALLLAKQDESVADCSTDLTIYKTIRRTTLLKVSLVVCSNMKTFTRVRNMSPYSLADLYVIS